MNIKRIAVSGLMLVSLLATPALANTNGGSNGTGGDAGKNIRGAIRSRFENRLGKFNDATSCVKALWDERVGHAESSWKTYTDSMKAAWETYVAARKAALDAFTASLKAAKATYDAAIAAATDDAAKQAAKDAFKEARKTAVQQLQADRKAAKDVWTSARKAANDDRVNRRQERVRDWQKDVDTCKPHDNKDATSTESGS